MAVASRLHVGTPFMFRLYPEWSIWNTNMTCLSLVSPHHLRSQNSIIWCPGCSCLAFILYAVPMPTAVVFHVVPAASASSCPHITPCMVASAWNAHQSLFSLTGWICLFLFSYSGSALVVIWKAFWPSSLVNCPSTLLPHHCTCFSNNPHYFVLKWPLQISFFFVFSPKSSIVLCPIFSSLIHFTLIFIL